MELPDSHNSFGVEVRGKSFFIGHTPVNISEGRIRINEVDLPLTQGLKELLFRSVPKMYSKKDLKNYKNILFETSAHKRGYDAFSSVNANKSIKYKTIISKLFPPKRPYSHRKSLKKNPKQLETANTNDMLETDVNHEEDGDRDLLKRDCESNENMVNKADDFACNEDQSNEDCIHYLELLVNDLRYYIEECHLCLDHHLCKDIITKLQNLGIIM